MLLSLKLEKAQSGTGKLVSWLKKTLRKTPYWTRGHQLFAEESLRSGDIPGAYAAAMTVLQCEPLGMLARDAHLVLASCYLKFGGAERAIEILTKAGADFELPVHAKEDLAAAYMALKQFDRAHEVIGRIATEELSLAGRAAKDFLRTQIGK